MWSLGIRSNAPLGNWQAFKTFPLIHISKIMIRWYSVFTSQSCWKSWSHLVHGRTLFFGVGGTSSTGSKGTVMEQLVSRTGGLDWNYIAMLCRNWAATEMLSGPHEFLQMHYWVSLTPWQLFSMEHIFSFGQQIVVFSLCECPTNKSV